jgi:predicted AlkP superfamily phosphohydrolase/phosphomutase
MQGTSFWHYLDERGIRLRGVQVASTYPPDHEGPNTELLSGLGVPDITGSPGSWTVYTTDQWLFSDKDTPTSGLVRKMFEDTPGTLQDELFGPTNWVKSAELTDRQKELEKLRQQSGLSTAELDRVGQELDAVKAESKTFHASGRHNDRAKVPFTMKLDKQGHAIDFDVAGTQFRVAQGEWSPFVPVTFELNSMFKAHGLAVFHVVRCDDEEVRIFVPPINIDPEDTPAQLPISAPPGFAAELEQEAGHPYETLGWACITNPLKDYADSKISEQSFMDDMVSTERLREDLLMASLARPDDWDVYFQVFSTPDRVGHMLYREFDPEHPRYDAALANTQVHAFGQTFPLKDAIRQVYMNEDRMVGLVLDALAAGRFGDDALLLIVSDHGFTSFRRQVNLNNVLHDLGFLQFKFKTDENGKPTTERYTLDELNAGPDSLHGYLHYVDWSATQAYSLGLGEVFVNLKGREPKGIVEPAQYDEVVEAIRSGLLSMTDPKDGTKYVTTASRRDKLYSGPWWHEGTAKRKTVGGREEEVGHDGFGDIFLGYAPHYRVSWDNTMGGLDQATVTDNDNHWSGDHVSVDPSHVPGVLFSNRKLPAGTVAGLIDVAPTILTRYGLDPSPPHTEMDGKVLPFENLTR